MATGRILTRLHKKGKDPLPRLAEFTECIVDYFDGTDGEATICTWLENNSLIISNDFSKSTHKLHIKHPSFCPIKGLKMTPVEVAENRKSSGINVGVCIILESADHDILLTKRAPHLHAFPNIWVPPGGHIDMDETITHAGLRELREETGLDIKESDCVEGRLVPLAIWESVYPPRLSLGAPSRHNVVLYLHAMLVSSLTTAALFQKLKFDPNEVAACVFVDRRVAAAIVKESEEREEREEGKEGEAVVERDPSLPQALRGLVLDDKKNQVEADVPLTPFFQRSSNEGDCERVSTGTKYALEQFLLKTKL